MSAYYEREGVRAWASGDVPHLLTTGPLLARAYVEVLEAFLSDCAAGRFGAVDPAEPLYVVELGAGTGRLAWNILHLLDPEACGALQVVYVLTDAVSANVEFWRTNARLRSLVDAGRLELACYDATEPVPISLPGRGLDLTPGSVRNPIAVIANYLFDVLAQDLFRCEGEDLLEELVAVVSDEEGLDPTSAGFFSRMWLATRSRPVAGERYGDPELDAVLAGVHARRGGDPPQRFLFPAATLRVVRNLCALSGGRMLLLSGERPGAVPPPPLGVSTGEDGAPSDAAEALRPGALLAMGVHGGTFSLPVDHGIVGSFVEARGGAMLAPKAAPVGLIVTAALFGDAGSARATRHHYSLAFGEGGPEDLFLALRAMRSEASQTSGTPRAPGEHEPSDVDTMSLVTLLVLMRVSGYDAHVFRQLYGRIQAAIVGASAEALDELVRVLGQVEERYFPIEDTTDVAFGIAALLAPAGRYEDALDFLERSRAERGPTPLGCFNAALCQALLGRGAEALVTLDEALGLDPDLEKAKVLKARIMEDPDGPGAPGGSRSPG